MRKGKMCAQCAHASMAVILDHLRRVRWSPVSLPPAMREWTGLKVDEFGNRIGGRFTKIVVSVNSKEELLEIYEKAKSAGIPCSLIEDAGFTEFGGVPTYTAVGIGPDYPERIDPITKELPLL